MGEKRFQRECLDTSSPLYVWPKKVRKAMKEVLSRCRGRLSRPGDGFFGLCKMKWNLLEGQVPQRSVLRGEEEVIYIVSTSVIKVGEGTETTLPYSNQ